MIAVHKNVIISEKLRLSKLHNIIVEVHIQRNNITRIKS